MAAILNIICEIISQSLEFVYTSFVLDVSVTT